MTKTVTIPLASLQQSETNPRKHFNRDELLELEASIRTHGLLQPLLVRPWWCRGRATPAEVQRTPAAERAALDPYEIVAGERRWRAMCHAPELTTAECRVMELSDLEAEDIQWIENLQRTDLTPIEEAQGFRDALARKGPDGEPLRTVEGLAAKINKSTDHIYERLKLVDLPKFLSDAVEHGHLPVRQATLVARIPVPDLRIQAGNKVLHGHGDMQPLSVKETRELLQRDYMRELKGAPFDQEAPSPHASACSVCSHRSGNIPGFDGGRGDICTNPTCFEKKAQLAFDRLAEQAEQQGKRVLPAAEAARHFDGLGELRFDSSLVRLNQRPADHLLKPEVKKAPRWAELVEKAKRKGLTVPVLLVQNPKKGVVEEMIDAAPLIAAADKLGEPIFRDSKADPRAKRVDPDDARIAEEKEKSKEQLDQSLHVLGELAKILEATCEGSPFVDAVFGHVVDAAQYDGRWMVAKLKGLKVDTGEFGQADAFEAYGRGLSPARREALVFLLLVAGEMRYDGPFALGVTSLAVACGVDLKKLVDHWKAGRNSDRKLAKVVARETQSVMKAAAKLKDRKPKAPKAKNRRAKR